MHAGTTDLELCMRMLIVVARRIARALSQVVRVLAAPGAGPKFFAGWA